MTGEESGEMIFTIHTQSSRRTECIPITREVNDMIRRQGYRNGVLFLFVPHTTAGITLNEQADPDVARDLEQWFDQLVPPGFPFRHAEGNSDAHLKATLAGSSLSVMVQEGRLLLGTWQGIWFLEFDGPRRRTITGRFIKAQ